MPKTVAEKIVYDTKITEYKILIEDAGFMKKPDKELLDIALLRKIGKNDLKN